MTDEAEREFSLALARAAALCETRLAEFVAEREAPFETPPRLRDAMRHALLAGGKRFRPFLLIEAAGLFAVAPQDAADAAAALECLHTYSLVHDDLPAMDDDALRRGRPTVHVAFDEATAILAGDALLSLAFEVLARPSTHADPEVRSGLVLILARAAGPAGMVGGQLLDIQAETIPPDEDGIRRLQAMKTGALIAAACEMGACMGGAGTAERRALVEYGRHLGLAFQIADDLLDIEAGPEAMGKATAKDAARGKATLVARLGGAGARTLLDASVAQCIATLAPFGARGAILAEAARFAAGRSA